MSRPRRNSLPWPQTGQRSRSDRQSKVENRFTPSRYLLRRSLPTAHGRCWRAKYNKMMRTIGKLLQVAGLVILPVSMMMQVTTSSRAPTGAGFSVSTMLLMMVLGVAIFSLGRFLEGYAK
jgi:hypothetical protein